jgi:hypothetical protein
MPHAGQWVFQAIRCPASRLPDPEFMKRTRSTAPGQLTQQPEPALIFALDMAEKK